MSPSPRRDTLPLVLALAFLVWLGFATIAVAGGVVRVVWLEPRLGTGAANMVETLGLVGILGATVWAATPWLVPGLSRSRLRALGIFWAALTIVFEFGFGHFVAGATWDALLSNYDVTAGRLWILVPLTMGLGPVIIGALRTPDRPSLTAPRLDS